MGVHAATDGVKMNSGLRRGEVNITFVRAFRCVIRITISPYVLIMMDEMVVSSKEFRKRLKISAIGNLVVGMGPVSHLSGDYHMNNSVTRVVTTARWRCCHHQGVGEGLQRSYDVGDDTGLYRRRVLVTISVEVCIAETTWDGDVDG